MEKKLHLYAKKYASGYKTSKTQDNSLFKKKIEIHSYTDRLLKIS